MNQFAGVLLLVAFAAASSQAAPGDVGTPPPTPGPIQERRIGEDILGSTTNPTRAVPQSVWIEGTVVDAKGAPIEGVVIKLFANGLVRGTAQSANDGKFSLEGNPPVGGNNSSVIWFQSPAPDRLLDSHVVLYAGDVARERRLFADCVQRVTIAGNTAEVEVTLLSEAERFAALEASGCLGRR
jgi:hypothetical protein